MRTLMAPGLRCPATEAQAAASEGRWPRICERAPSVRPLAAGARKARWPYVL